MAGLNFGNIGGDPQEYTASGEALVKDLTNGHIYSEKTISGTGSGSVSAMYDWSDTTALGITDNNLTAITFDLQKETLVKSFEAYFGMSANGTANRYMEYSKDGTTWTVLFQVLNQSAPESKYTKVFGNFKARYLRLRQTMVTAGAMSLNAYTVAIIT